MSNLVPAIRIKLQCDYETLNRNGLFPSLAQLLYGATSESETVRTTILEYIRSNFNRFGSYDKLGHGLCLIEGGIDSVGMWDYTIELVATANAYNVVISVELPSSDIKTFTPPSVNNGKSVVIRLKYKDGLFEPIIGALEKNTVVSPKMEQSPEFTVLEEHAKQQNKVIRNVATTDCLGFYRCLALAFANTPNEYNTFQKAAAVELYDKWRMYMDFIDNGNANYNSFNRIWETIMKPVGPPSAREFRLSANAHGIIIKVRDFTTMTSTTYHPREPANPTPILLLVQQRGKLFPLLPVTYKKPIQITSTSRKWGDSAEESMPEIHMKRKVRKFAGSSSPILYQPSPVYHHQPLFHFVEGLNNTDECRLPPHEKSKTTPGFNPYGYEWLDMP